MVHVETARPTLAAVSKEELHFLGSMKNIFRM